MRLFLISCIISFHWFHVSGNTGYSLWLDYRAVPEKVVQAQYNFIQEIHLSGFSMDDPIVKNAVKIAGKQLSLLLGKSIRLTTSVSSKALQIRQRKDLGLGKEGYKIICNASGLDLLAENGAGVLYGVFDLLSRIHRQTPLLGCSLENKPALQHRVLNHWDNLDRTVERGYAGFSIFNWHELPEVKDPRYSDYAMANASIGINGTVLTNVNAKALVLREDYLEKAAALADIFRPFHLKVYLTARFSAPIELGGLTTADPLNPDVIRWWQTKIDEIYKKIPDFGGFLVKANSEGQPGPQDYGRSHADGANMLANALKPHGGIVMWRAFVYNAEKHKDRFTQAFDEFSVLDGKFASNVLIQVKNGPIDFQPREPVHALFGSMPHTPLMLELQITKEYLGQGTHLVGLASMYEEILKAPVYVNRQAHALHDIINGQVHGYPITGIAGVSNVGNAMNWTGNLFAQADWYSFGKLAWNPASKAEDIFKEWISSTFPQSPKLNDVALFLLQTSHEACVQYMTPLGLHHIMAEGHHYGPGPWVDGLARADWTSVYYHKANKDSIGFDRTSRGNGALRQYPQPYESLYGNLNTCPETFLLWYHRLPWDYTMKSGRSLWHEMVFLYDQGVRQVEKMSEMWDGVEGDLDEERFQSVREHLMIQLKEAKWWRNACLAYFYSIHQLEFPEGTMPPPREVSYYKSLTFPFAPGIRPSW